MAGDSESAARGSASTRGLARGPGGWPRSVEMAQSARRQVGELTGKDPETVTAMRRDGAGWVVEIDVVESHRVPDTTDRMAVYEATLDGTGEIVGLRRLRSYVRAWLGDHGRTP